MEQAGENVLALDVGAARIGLALANTFTRLPAPAGALAHDDRAIDTLRVLCSREGITRVVIGLPRGMNGQETKQTAAVQTFGAKLASALALPISWQDEAVTSIRAEEELIVRGRPYTKADIDALAATYILEDYLGEHI